MREVGSRAILGRNLSPARLVHSEALGGVAGLVVTAAGAVWIALVLRPNDLN